jgi:hypothetical protein
MNINKIWFLGLLFISFSCSNNLKKNIYTNKNDTIKKNENIYVFFKHLNKLDSIIVYDKKFQLKEKGDILENIVYFKDSNNEIKKIGSIFNNTFHGNLLIIENKKIKKIIPYINGKEEGIELSFNENETLDLLVEYKKDTLSGFSLIFEKNFPKYIRTGNINDVRTSIGVFGKDGVIQEITCPNINNFDYDIMGKIKKN